MINIPQHREIFIQVLKDIYLDKEIGPILGFKGGTAAYLFYGLSRFSVDLDFNLLDINKKVLVLAKIKEILEKYGQIDQTKEKFYTLFFLLIYEKGQRHLKIEISKRGDNDNYEVLNYLGTPILVMRREDMFANKMVALLGRKEVANRDLYDIWFFLQNQWEINKEVLEKRTKKKIRDYWQACIKVVEEVDERYILSEWGELIEEKQKIWAKEHLKNELLFLLKLYGERWEKMI